MHTARRRLAVLTATCCAVVALLAGIDDHTLDVTPAPAASVEVAAPTAQAAQPAALHYDNTLIYYGCGATRQHEEHTLDHTHLLTMGPGYLYGSCRSHAEQMVCNWTLYVTSTFVFGPVNPTCQVVG